MLTEERAPLSEEKDMSDNRIRSHGNARVSAKVRPPSYQKKQKKNENKNKTSKERETLKRAENERVTTAMT